VLLGSAHVKAAGKMLVKSTAGVNFIDIYTCFFANILAPKNFKPKTQLCNFWRQNFGQKT